MEVVTCSVSPPAASHLYPSFQGLMSDNDTVRLGLDFQRMLRINHMLYIAARSVSGHAVICCSFLLIMLNVHVNKNRKCFLMKRSCCSVSRCECVDTYSRLHKLFSDEASNDCLYLFNPVIENNLLSPDFV